MSVLKESRTLWEDPQQLLLIRRPGGVYQGQFDLGDVLACVKLSGHGL